MHLGAFLWQTKLGCEARDHFRRHEFAVGIQDGAMSIRDRPTTSRSPWQNGHTERLIGSIRHECLDHVVVFSERHLRHVLLL